MSDHDIQPDEELNRTGFRRSRSRYILFGAAIFLLTIIVFYAQENVRGQRAWRKCKQELEAQGKVLDWSNYIPAPVPDDQNIFKAPGMEAFIKGAPPTALAKHLQANRKLAS